MSWTEQSADLALCPPSLTYSTSFAGFPHPRLQANLVGVLNSKLESTRFQRLSAKITDSESVVVRGFAETPTGLGLQVGRDSDGRRRYGVCQWIYATHSLVLRLIN